MVTVYVGIVWTRIFGLPKRHSREEFIIDKAELNVTDKINNILRYHPLGFYYKKQYQNKKNVGGSLQTRLIDGKEEEVMVGGVDIPVWDGYNNLLYENKTGEHCYYTLSGLIPRVIRILNENGIEYKVVKQYNADKIKVVDEKLQLNGIELRYYQSEAVELAKKKKRGILHVATGGGKSIILAKLAQDIKGKVLIVVNRTTLFRQLIDTIKSALGLSEEEINYFGDIKQYDPNNRVTVATFQSLVAKEKILVEGKGKKKKWKEETILRHKDMLETIECFLGDEIHHIENNMLGMLTKACKNAIYRIGVSATPWRTDNADLMLEAHMGPILYKKTVSDLIREGYLAKPKIYMLKMPYDIDPKLSYGAMFKKLNSYEYKNKIMADIAYRLANKGRSVLISFTRIENLELVREEIDKLNVNGLVVENIIGEDTAENKMEAVKKLNSGHFNIVLSTLFGEGVDVSNLSTLINMCNSKSSIGAYQQTGRILRKGDIFQGQKIVIDTLEQRIDTDGGKVMKYEDIMDDFDMGNIEVEVTKIKEDNPDYFQNHAMARLKIYQSEPEFEVKVIDSVDEIEELRKEVN